MNEWEWGALEEHAIVESLPHETGELRVGARVRLRPRARGGDAMDALLAGKTAVIESIEQDYEGGFHLAVVLDDDPGRDLGFMRQPGHRFFYAPGEVERCADTPPILIAGIGNIFLGDDGFGVEVARRLLASELPPGVRVVDYGIRGLDLTYALAGAAGVAILIDACSRGAPPGTLFVIEPEIDGPAEHQAALLDAHSMNPVRVIQTARSMGGDLSHVLLLGCEPATFGPEEGHLGLSDVVAAAVDEAVALVLTLVRRIHNHDWPGEGGLLPPERSGFEDGKP
jgi:hydrogenase maturation protease